ncbi:hypothetical protein U1Q18_044733 [Sarracenia purpurea var. burkii]
MQMNVKPADFGLAVKRLPGKLYDRDFAGVRKIRLSFAAPSFEHLTDAGHAASLHCLFRPSSTRRRIPLTFAANQPQRRPTPALLTAAGWHSAWLAQKAGE